MTRARTRRVFKTLVASTLLSVLLLPGLATADPHDDVEEVLDDYLHEWLPRTLDDAPGWVEFFLDNPPDAVGLVEAINYPQPEELPDLLLQIAESAPEWLEHFGRAPTRIVVTWEHERTDEGLTITERYRVSYQGAPDRQGSWSRTYLSCNGPTSERLCDAIEDVLTSPVSPSEVTVLRNTHRSSDDLTITVKAGVTLTGGDKQEQSVTAPAIPCTVGPACDAVGVVLD